MPTTKNDAKVTTTDDSSSSSLLLQSRCYNSQQGAPSAQGTLMRQGYTENENTMKEKEKANDDDDDCPQDNQKCSKNSSFLSHHGLPYLDWNSSSRGSAYNGDSGRLVDFDDGHIPENLLVHNNNNRKNKTDDDDDDDDDNDFVATAAGGGGRLVEYPRFLNRCCCRSAAASAVQVWDDVVDKQLVDALYRFTTTGNDDLKTTTASSSSSWGTYVTMQQVKEYWRKGEDESLAASTTGDDSSAKAQEQQQKPPQSEDDLALRAVEAFLRHAMKTPSSNKGDHNHDSNNGDDGPSTPSASTTAEPASPASPPPPSPLWTMDDCDLAHGVAVWALSAPRGSQVPYHLDYAEQVRYESNIIVPPVLAGTLQCTPVVQGQMKGGDFVVLKPQQPQDDQQQEGEQNHGLKHYETFGYKGMKQKLPDFEQTTDGATTNDSSESQQWLRIPYRYNRMIIQPGHLPHLSTKIESFGSEDHTYDSNIRRVIVGFNVFLNDIGPIVQDAPEHSAVFNQKVKMQRQERRQREKRAAAGGCCFKDGSTSSSGSTRLSLQAVRSNPKVAKLLVLAKREKVKQDLCRAQERLTHQLTALLQEEDDDGHGLLVEDLMERLCHRNCASHGSSSSFPTAVDVQVHIHHLCRKGVFQVVHHDCVDECGDKTNFENSSPQGTASNSDRSTAVRKNSRDLLISPLQRIRLP